MDEYKGLQNGWITKLLGQTRSGSSLLAGIEVAWSFTLLAIEKADFRRSLRPSFAKLCGSEFSTPSLLYGVTPGGGGWIPAIMDSFHILGQTPRRRPLLGQVQLLGLANMSVDLFHHSRVRFSTGFSQ
jgi:hypothetical protein